MSKHNTPYVNSNSLSCINGEYEAPKSSNYVNLQMNRTNKPSTDINLTESEIGSYAALQRNELSKNNYEDLKLNL